jgi:hypothetical protein
MLDGYIVLSTTTADGIYVDLGLPTGRSAAADIDLLREIAATLRQPTP